MEPIPGTVRQDNWFVLLDPGWEPDTPLGRVPVHVIVGGWMLDDEGKVGPFQPNPRYVPPDDTTPTDPIDAILRLVVNGENRGHEIIPTLRDTIVQIGCDQDDEPVIAQAPDDMPCVLVVTAEVHKLQLSIPHWWPVVGSRLADIVPDGADILVNPGSSHQFRLVAGTLRDTPQS